MSEQEREQTEVEGQGYRWNRGEEAPENPQETTGEEEREDDDPEVEGQPFLKR